MNWHSVFFNIPLWALIIQILTLFVVIKEYHLHKAEQNSKKSKLNISFIENWYEPDCISITNENNKKVVFSFKIRLSNPNNDIITIEKHFCDCFSYTPLSFPLFFTSIRCWHSYHHNFCFHRIEDVSNENDCFIKFPLRLKPHEVVDGWVRFECRLDNLQNYVDIAGKKGFLLFQLSVYDLNRNCFSTFHSVLCHQTSTSMDFYSYYLSSPPTRHNNPIDMNMVSSDQLIGKVSLL